MDSYKYVSNPFLVSVLGDFPSWVPPIVGFHKELLLGLTRSLQIANATTSLHRQQVNVLGRPES